MYHTGPKPRNLFLRLLVGVVGVYFLLAILYFAAEHEWLWTGLCAMAGLYGVWWAFPRNRVEAKEVRFPSDDAFEYIERVAAADAGRRKCPCCRYPTFTDDAAADCLLCEWDPEDEIELHEARENFTRYGSVYPSDQRPVWSPAPPSAAERAAAQSLIEAYKEHKAAARQDTDEGWLAVLNAEAALAQARERWARELS